MVFLYLRPGSWLSTLAFGAVSLRLGFSLQGRDEHFLFSCVVLSNLLIFKGRQQQKRKWGASKGELAGGCSESQYLLLTACCICLSSWQREVWKAYQNL